MPVWLPKLCPNVKHLHLLSCAAAEPEQASWDFFEEEEEEDDASWDPEQRQEERLRQAVAAAAECGALESITLDGWGVGAAPAQELLRRQLEALPALRSIKVDIGSWDGELAALVGRSVTHFESHDEGEEGLFHGLAGLPAQFPSLREAILDCITLFDGDVDALFSIPTLKKLRCDGVRLERTRPSRAACSLEIFESYAFDVPSLALLPWASIQAVRAWIERVEVKCSPSAATAAAVAAELRRTLQRRPWPVCTHDLNVHCRRSGSEALVAHLPIIQLLWPEHSLRLHDCEGLTAAALQQLGQHAPPDGERELGSLDLQDCSLAPDAWAALLPAAAAAGTGCVELHSTIPAPTAEQLVTMCKHATHSVHVVVVLPGSRAAKGSKALVERVLREAGNPQVQLCYWS